MRKKAEAGRYGFKDLEFGTCIGSRFIIQNFERLKDYNSGSAEVQDFQFRICRFSRFHSQSEEV